VAAALAAIVVVLLGLWQPWRAGIPGGAASAARLAVLYLENLSPDTLDAYLADGLTEEITSRVGRIPGIQTKSRNAVRRYRDSLPADLLAVAESLSVDYLLEGSVRRSGEHVRVTVNLVRGSDGFRAWGDDYDREVTDLLTLQEEIAREIAGNIGGRLAPEDLVALGEPAGVIPAAYTSFVRGQGRLTDRSPRSVLRAVQHYRDAVAADPTFARAWARLAYGYALFLDWRWEYPGLTRDSVLALGFSAASRALERDSSLSDGWMARGYLLSFRHPQTFEGVHEAFRRALALDSDNAEAHHQYGWLLMYMGEDEEATAQFERALALEPERTITVFGLGFLTYRLRQMEEAGRWLDSSLTLEPSFAAGYGQRALLALRLGDTAAARADAETGSRLGYVPSDAPLGVLAVQNGDTVRAEALAERLLEHGYIGPTAFVLAALGRPEQALDVLETAELGLEFWTESLRAPELDALRSYPRFERLVREARGVAQR
jgi:TolB-like protein/Tfp pilus assembly protein PilF